MTVVTCVLMHAMVMIPPWTQAAGIPPVSDLSKLEAMLKGSTDSDEIVRLRAFTAEFGCYLSEDRSVANISAWRNHCRFLFLMVTRFQKATQAD